MLQFIFGVFIMLHGLVHLLYFGQSARRFELRPGLIWPDGSWAFSKLLGEKATRALASIACALAAVGFVVGGVGILVSQTWWRPVIVTSAAFSAALYIMFWDGKVQNLDGKGVFAILINAAILAVVLIWKPFK